MTPQTKTTGPTQLSAITQEERAFLDSSGTDKTGKKLFPSESLSLSEATLAQLLDHDNLIKINKGDLLPSATFATQDSSGKDLPIYLIPDKDDNVSNTPEVRLMHTKEGAPYILINERYHKLTEAKVYENFLSKADIKDAIHDKALSKPGDVLATLRKEKAGTPEFEAIQHRYKELLHFLSQDAKAQGIDKPHFLIDMTPNEFSHGEATNILTKENKSYIFINKEYFLNALNSNEATEEAKATIGHELWHIKDGDPTPAGIVRGHDLAIAREHELLADLGGAGPLGSRNLKAAAKDLENALRKEIPAYLKYHPGSGISADHPTDEDLKTISDWRAEREPTHPSDLDRIAALQEEEKLIKQYEIKFQETHHHKPTSKQELVAESKAVIDQVMREIHDKTLPPADLSFLNARAAGANPSAPETSGNDGRVETIKANLGNKYQQQASLDHVEIPSAPMTVPISDAARSGQKSNPQSV